jgi:hypothetical protein
MDNTGLDIGHDSSSRSLNLKTGGSDRLVIAGDGKVGIGTSPDSKLHVASGNVLISNNQFYTAENTGGTNYKLAGLTSGNVIQIGAIDYTSASTVFAGGDNLRLTTGGASGTTRLYINSSGNVGIGTTNPVNKLDVAGIVRVAESSNVAFYAGNYVRVFGDQNYGFRDSGGTYKAQISMSGNSYFNGGNVGIGTNNPSNELTVSGAGTVASFISSNSKSILNLSDDGGDTNLISNSGTFHIGSSSTDLAKLMINLSTGKVGIGTSSPAQKLDVRAGHIRLDAGYSLQWDNSHERIEQSDGHLKFFVNNTESMTLDTNGLGIGTTSPSEKLDITGGFLKFNGGDYGLKGSASLTYNPVSDHYFQSSGNTKVVFKASGNVGIGTTNPNAKLKVNGAIVSQGGSYSSGVDSNITDVGLVMTKGDYLYSDDGNYLRKLLGHTSSGVIEIGQSGTALITDINLRPGTSGNIGFFASGSEDIRINSSGNVGIGTTNPTTKLYIEDQGVNWNVTTPGTTLGTLHLDPVGNGANNTGNALTFGASDSSSGGTAQAGIYIRSDGSYGTKMYLATTDSYNSGSKTRLAIDHNGNVGIGVTNPSYKLQVGGSIVGTSKSFLIKHPTKEGKKLLHACIEGPENGVYYRGKSTSNIIEMPDYWIGLVHIDSMTVDITAIGPNQDIYVDSISDDGDVTIGSNTDAPLNYFYVIYGERKDIGKLETEIDDPD